MKWLVQNKWNSVTKKDFLEEMKLTFSNIQTSWSRVTVWPALKCRLGSRTKYYAYTYKSKMDYSSEIKMYNLLSFCLGQSNFHLMKTSGAISSDQYRGTFGRVFCKTKCFIRIFMLKSLLLYVETWIKYGATYFLRVSLKFFDK